jgi:hypothetical protein
MRKIIATEFVTLDGVMERREARTRSAPSAVGLFCTGMMKRRTSSTNYSRVMRCSWDA